MAVATKLTLVPYLQRWDHVARTLSIRLLIAPTGNPLAPLVDPPAGVAAFADARFAFTVKISDTVGALPQRTLVDQTTVLPDPGAVPPTVNSPNARATYADLHLCVRV